MSDSHGPSRLDDEPQTPMWLPALGAALFLGVGLWWAVQPSPPPPARTEGPAPSSATAAAPGAATAPPTALGRPAQPAMPPSNMAAQPRPAPTNLPPDLQRRINQARAHAQP